MDGKRSKHEKPNASKENEDSGKGPKLQRLDLSLKLQRLDLSQYFNGKKDQEGNEVTEWMNL
jgi:hypothetical protein